MLSLSGQGLQLTEIAARLSLSEGAVCNYMSSAITKLGTINKVAAFRLAGRGRLDLTRARSRPNRRRCWFRRRRLRP